MGVDNIVGKHFFNIDIIYPIEFNELDSLYEERANSIACEIVDLLDNKPVKGEVMSSQAIASSTWQERCQTCVWGLLATWA